MAVSSINIAPSVIAAASINITGNLDGLRHAMNEARAQLYGFLTISNAVGGKLFALIFNPIAVRSGMRAIDQAMTKAEQAFDQRTSQWRKVRPRAGQVTPANLQRDYPELYNEFMGLPAHLQTARGYRKLHANFKPDKAAIAEEFVHPATQAQQKMLMFSTAIGVVGSALAKSVGYASAFNEQLNKTIQTFGVSSGMLTRNAAGAASGGLSRTGYLQGTSTLGIELLGAGMDEKGSAKLSSQLTERAKDVASLYDIEVATVLDKMRAGLAGFGRPLKELGIVITEGRVEAKAAAMGLYEHGHELSEEARITARAALIMQLSNRAQGDFARTSGGYANQLRTLSASWDNFMTELGLSVIRLAEYVLPGVNKAMNYVEMAAKEVNDQLSWHAKTFSFDQLEETREKEKLYEKQLASDRIKEEKDAIKADEEAARKSKSVHHYDLAGYAKHLQESLMDKDSARAQLAALRQIAINTAKNPTRKQYAPGSIAPEHPM